MDPTQAANISAWANAISAAVALVGSTFIVKSILQATKSLDSQRVTRDLESVLALWERLDVHWCRFRAASDNDRHFEFGQLIAYYELSCGLFRNQIISTAAAETLREHLRDVLTAMQNDNDFEGMFQKLQSHEDTFANIRWFQKYGDEPLTCGAIWTNIQKKLTHR